MAPIIIALVQETALSLAALAAIIVPLMLALMIMFIQPAKGAMIALQWWFGMHGFVKERPALEASERETDSPAGWPLPVEAPQPARSEERRVGKEGVSTCRSRW